MENNVNKNADELSKDEIIVQLMQLLMDNQMKQESHRMFEMSACVDVISDKLETMTRQITELQKEISLMREDSKQGKSLKDYLSDMVVKAQKRTRAMKSSIESVKEQIKEKASDIVRNFKVVGRAALNGVSELFGIRKKLESMKTKVMEGIVDTDNTLSKLDEFGKGMREAGIGILNSFRILGNKPMKEYTDEEKKFSKTELLKMPWKWQKKVYQSMEKHLNHAIESVKDLSARVQVDELNRKWDEIFDSSKEMKEDVERVTGEVVPVVAENGTVYGEDIESREDIYYSDMKR